MIGLRSFTSQFNPSGKRHNMSRNIDIEAGLGMLEGGRRNHIPSFSFSFVGNDLIYCQFNTTTLSCIDFFLLAQKLNFKVKINKYY